jgi:hypothetical protein
MRANYLISLEQKILNNQELVFMNRERLSRTKLPSHKRGFVKSVLATMRERGVDGRRVDGRRPPKAPIAEEVPTPEQIQETAQELGMPLRETGGEPDATIEIHKQQAETETPATQRVGRSAVGGAIGQSA